MVFKKGVKCFGLLLVLSIIFGLSLSVSSDANAASTPLSTSRFDLYWTPRNGNSRSWTNNILYGSTTSNNFAASDIEKYQFNTPSFRFKAQNGVLHFETNIVQSSAVMNSPSYWSNLGHLALAGCSGGSDGALQIVDWSISSAVTEWTQIVGNYEYKNYTLTVYGDVVFTGYTEDVNQTLTCMVTSDNSSLPFYVTMPPYPSDYPVVYFEQNPMTIEFTEEITNALLKMQNNLLQHQNDLMEEQFNRETEGLDNISGQSASDIEGSTNQQTTNLISYITFFFNKLSTISASNCNLSLPFPSYAGGIVTVNPCDGKQYFEQSEIITIAGTLLFLGFTIPLCFLILRLIFNEIRSWTNG